MNSALIDAPLCLKDSQNSPDDVCQALAAVLLGLSKNERKSEDRVLILADNPLGLLYLQQLSDVPSAQLLYADTSKERCQLVAEQCHLETLLLPCSDLNEKVAKILGDYGVQIAVVCHRNPELQKLAVDSLLSKGAWVIFHSPAQGQEMSILTTRLHYDQLTITGSSFYDQASLAQAQTILQSHPQLLQAL